ncbi:MAG: terminase small subunit [bacterium]
MNPKYKEFCQYYLFYNNIKIAASLSGYKLSTAKNLLKNPEVQAYLSNMQSKIATSNEIMECLTTIMRGSPISKMPSEEAFTNLSSELHSQTLEFLNSLETSTQTKSPKQISTREQLKAAELLGKALSLFNPKSLINNSLDSSLHKSPINQNITFIGSDQILK